MDLQRLKAEFARIKAEYEAPARTVMGDEDAKVSALLRIVSECLTPGERAFFLLYVDRQSLADVAREFDISKRTVWVEIHNIRKKIIENYEKGKGKWE